MQPLEATVLDESEAKKRARVARRVFLPFTLSIGLAFVGPGLFFFFRFDFDSLCPRRAP